MTAAAQMTAWAVAMTVTAAAGAAGGQTMDVERPRTLVVGSPAGGARTDRVDCARTGRSRNELPSSGLRTEWRTPLGTLVERAPLVDERGDTYVVGTRGEVVAIGRDGTERWRAPTGAAQPGPLAILSDDTVVFVDAAGEAVAVRDGLVRWRLRFGRGDALHPAPLPLEDGGVVVATTHELAALDSDGRERARTTLPEPTSLPLVAALGKVVAVTVSGAVWSWAPGATELVRVANFGSAVDGGAALADDHTLLAVTAGQVHLTAIDLLRGTATTRAVAPAGVWLGPPAMRGATAHLVLRTLTGELAVGVDASGREVSRTLLTVHPPPAAVDGGVAALVGSPHTPPLIDSSGTLAFATVDGAIGVASGGAVELLGEACEPPLGSAAHAAPPVVGLAPLEAGVFVAVCHAGAVLAITAGGRKAAPHL
jgi:putative pyrroloquinoline-quinone binding quinoprotein